MCCRPWGRKESDTTEQLNQQQQVCDYLEKQIPETIRLKQDQEICRLSKAFPFKAI